MIFCSVILYLTIVTFYLTVVTLCHNMTPYFTNMTFFYLKCFYIVYISKHDFTI